jgi:methionyl-tRNA formyltransferase
MSVLAEGEGAPGQVLDDALTIACGDGAVRLTRVQRPGKAAQSAEEMLRGFPVPIGTILSGPRSECSAFSTRRGL